MEEELEIPVARDDSTSNLDINGDDDAEGSLDLLSLAPLSHSHPLLSAPTFSADNFLLSRIHIPLEELRGELRSYLALLKEELVQLINDDYEAFISLGTGLHGEGYRLKRLQGPLRSIGSDVGQVRDVLVGLQEEIQSKLDERAHLREEKTLLDLLRRLFDTLARAEKLLDEHDTQKVDEKTVQRAAGEYAQLVYLVDKAQAEGCSVVDTVKSQVDTIRSRLSAESASLLSKALEDPSVGRFRQVLHIYELLGTWQDAEGVVARHFRDFARSTISASNRLGPPATPITPAIQTNPFDRGARLEDDTPLAGIYNQFLQKVEQYQPLLAAAEDIGGLCDFFVGAMWTELATAINEELGSVIFTAGRPNELHKHYSTTARFIELLEDLAPSAEAATALRESEPYQKLEKRWQLPVYFQLRWKEIVPPFETALSMLGEKAPGWGMAQSAAAWKAVSTCWAKDVYLPELASRFWRLSLQVSERYSSWLSGQVSKLEALEKDEEQLLQLLSSGIVDLDKLRQNVNEIDLIRENELSGHLFPPNDTNGTKITNILTKRCIEALKPVRSVASQLRSATTTSTPVAPSYFVASVLKPLKEYYTAQPGVKATYGRQWSEAVVDAVCASYAGNLASVRKTEDLLRRHRKSKKGGFSLFGGGGAAADDGAEDEEKFRKQIQADIQCLKGEAKKLDVDVDALAGWKELVEVVNRPSE